MRKIKIPSKKRTWLLLASLAIVVIIFTSVFGSQSNRTTGAAVADTCLCYSTVPSQGLLLNFNDSVPGDLQSFNNQAQADCFAWQEFISLNWPVNAQSSFGVPLDTGRVQWETYMPREVMFPPGGQAPPVWGTLVAPKYAAKFKTQRLFMGATRTKLLTITSKMAQEDSSIAFNISQAAPVGAPAWLGTQDSTNVWYEIMLNQDYYNYIVSNGFYNAKAQHDSINAGKRISFPEGSYYTGATGAIELKAAWIEVKNINLPKWRRYKLSRATVLDPYADTLRSTIVALVGLHVLHKTQTQTTWVWATFEQVDNVPGSGGTPPYGYTFYNANCVSRHVAVKTPRGDSSVLVSCVPNTSPPYYLNQANPVPIQITRQYPIDPGYAVPVNTRMQNKISTLYPNSVWQYYQLINVIWNGSGIVPYNTSGRVPGSLGTAMQPAQIVANSTLESYVTNTTCTGCHTYSTIAPYPPDSGNNNMFGDFSFALMFASYSPGPLAKMKAVSKMK